MSHTCLYMTIYKGREISSDLYISHIRLYMAMYDHI